MTRNPNRPSEMPLVPDAVATTPRLLTSTARRLAEALPRHRKTAGVTARVLRGIASIIDTVPARNSPARPLGDHRWRSPLLGRPRTAELDAGSLQYYECGTGPTVVFLHGWLANANLWRNVVPALSNDYRCITVDLPLGAHREPLPPSADLSPDGIAALIAELLDHIGETDVTLVGNDSGGAYAQIAIARHTDRVRRFVITSSETPHDHWPPAQFGYLCDAARNPQALADLAEGLTTRPLQAAGFGPTTGITKWLPPQQILDTYALPMACDHRIRDNTAIVMGSSSSAALHSASRTLMTIKPVRTLLLWSAEDPVFPVAHAKRFADELPDATLVTFDDSYSFTPEDQPNAVADGIKAFLDASPLKQ